MDNCVLDTVQISEETIKYRVENLVYSQNMLNTWNRSKKEFFEKYILDIFWSDDEDVDLAYQENMAFGRDFHTMCQRIFLDISSVSNFEQIDSNQYSTNIKKIENIKRMYIEKYGDNVEFHPEYSILLNGKIQVVIDLVVFIYKDKKISSVDIWDWKTEGKKIEKANALNRMQTRVYLFVCKESIGRDVDFGNINMHYYQPHLENNVLIEYSEEMYLRDRKYILDLVKEIEKYEFRRAKWE